MKVRITTLVLVILFILIGCTPPTNPKQSQEIDLSIVPANISNGCGRFASTNGFIYITETGAPFILEYDLETGKTQTLSMRKGDTKHIQTIGSQRTGYRTRSNLFVLPSGIGFIEECTENFIYQDSQGKNMYGIRHLKGVSVLDYNGGSSIQIPELGSDVYKVIPVKKASSQSGGTDGGSDDTLNPLSGLDLYYLFGYDTFPEKAAELQQEGIILEEPVDENERKRYLVDALGYMDGDTRETKIIMRDFSGDFTVDEEYIYIIQSNGENQGNRVYRGNRYDFDMELLDLGGPVGNIIICHDGGFFFSRSFSWQICQYKDGKIVETPIVSANFIPWQDQMIFYDFYWENTAKYNPIKSYDMNTGEIRTLCENTDGLFCLLEDRYVACRQYAEEFRVDFLIDLETGEQRELYRTEQ